MWIEGRSAETVMLQLLVAHCLPILTWAIKIIQVANRDEYLPENESGLQLSIQKSLQLSNMGVGDWPPTRSPSPHLGRASRKA